MSEVAAEYQVDSNQEVQPVPLSVKYMEKVQEITNCSEEQAQHIAELTYSMISEAVDHLLNDHSVMQSMFSNMMRVQLNNNVRLDNITQAQARLEYIVVDEAHPASELRVTYATEDASTWVFEQPVDGGWTEVPLSADQRPGLEALAGKYFNGRVGFTGYIVEVGAMNRFDARQGQ